MDKVKGSWILLRTSFALLMMTITLMIIAKILLLVVYNINSGNHKKSFLKKKSIIKLVVRCLII